MRADEKPAFGEAITMAMAYWKEPMTPFALDVWWQACQPFELRDVKAALSRHAMGEWGHRAPLVADITKALLGTSGDRAALAWGKVYRAIREVGMYRSVVFDEPAIHAAIDDIGGWPALGQSQQTELPFLQRRFSDAYRAYDARGAATWQPVLAGIAEMQNALNGKRIAAPSLVGDPEGCARVMRGPDRQAQLAASAVKLIAWP